MSDQVLHVKLIQSAAVVAGTGILMINPEFSVAVAVFVSVVMAFSMASTLCLGHYYSSNQIEKLSRRHAALLGTHFGGLACYLVMICEAFKHIH